MTWGVDAWAESPWGAVAEVASPSASTGAATWAGGTWAEGAWAEEAAQAPAPAPQPGGQTPAGRPKRRQLVVEIDGQDVVVESEAQAQALLDEQLEQAKQAADLAMQRAAKAQRRPARKVLQDARRALVAPTIVAPEFLSAEAQKVSEQIRALYASAIQTIEIGVLLRRQAEEDDEEALVMLL